ncbi:MAC/perforin domain-containing protein [Erythrobacter sp. BLCC-B19]|uniref:MAC/perforin domain-containing protein n=1 Tax=Erythrobacter sp. BLCC-B19 TaxID=3025315 RepID=UPI00235E9693|nr:MAC/perforin domain-containing protein [Erythrobacter sp. BLCC-B19]WDA42837.1 MAC/perforin domain-containing protein [Erythrobacter sp. BLCC-B19]
MRPGTHNRQRLAGVAGVTGGLVMTRKAWLLLNCMTLSAALIAPAAAPVAAQEAGVNGTNVARVEFNQGRVIQKAAAKVWVEYDPAGNAAFRFEERGRDEWSVYLYDPSRNMRLAVDLHTRTLSIDLASGERQVIGTITGASVTPRTAARQPAQPQQMPTPTPPPVYQAPPQQPAFTRPAAPASTAAPVDDDFNPFADPAQPGAQTATTTTPPRTTPRDVITAAAQPAFTRGAAGTSGPAAAALSFDGPWVADTKLAQSSGDGIADAVTWTMREALWITSTDSAITIHFDANPAGSVTLMKVADSQYQGDGYSAAFTVIDRKTIRLALTGGGRSREYAISKGPSGIKLSRTRTRPETDDEIDTFTAGNLVPRYKDMFFSFRSEKMDLFNANRGRALQIFKEPESTDFSIESNFQSKTIPLGLRAEEIRRTEGNQLEAVITNTSSFEKSMSLNFGASGSFKGVNSAWEYSREESKGADRTDGTTKAFGLARSEVYALLLDKPNMLLSADFKYDILQLAQGRTSAQAIIGKYGTHYANAIHYGGIGKAQRSVTTSEFKQWAKESNGFKQEGGFDGGPAASIKAKGGLTMASGDSRGGSSMFSTESWSASGGSGSMTSLGWNVDERNAVPVRYDLRPLSELISPIFFGEEWSTAQRAGLLQARASLDAEITRYLQSQPRADERTLGPAVYQLTFHGLQCVNNGDEGKADAYLYGDINVQVIGQEPGQTVNLFTAQESNPTKISCNGGAEHPINRTVFVTGSRKGDGAASFLMSASGLFEDDNSFTDLDDPIYVLGKPIIPGQPMFGTTPAFVTLRDWRADRPRSDIEGTTITNAPGVTYGPELRVSVSFKEIQ